MAQVVPLATVRNWLSSGLHIYLPQDDLNKVVFANREFGSDSQVQLDGNLSAGLRSMAILLQNFSKSLAEYNAIAPAQFRLGYTQRGALHKALGVSQEEISSKFSSLIVSTDTILEAKTLSEAETPASATSVEVDSSAVKRRKVVDGYRRVPIVSRFEVLQPPGGLDLFLQSLKPMLDQSSEKLGWVRKTRETRDVVIYSTRSENLPTVDPYSGDARHLGVTTPAHSMVGVLRPMMQQRRQHKTYKPIIIVSQASSSLLSIWNAKRFLEDGEFVTTQEAKQAAEDPTRPPSSVDVSCVKWIKGEELERMQIKHRGLFKIIDNPERLKPSEWDMVCCAFVTSSTWQFRGWFSTNPVEIFDRCRGYHLSYTEEPPKGDVTAWKVRLLNIPKDRRLSHTYKGVVREFWLDLFKTTIRTRQNMQEA